ncbi:outer membrane protein [Gynuella sunshinyii YC6258]|uniref:Outer membrane protein n=2 Tax=Gynuella sunshinyii TaxID=1445505 RepID=A0A0C5VUQ0_9GAMM|nr:outer membrane protein [Gynuella sunshinyii YC6258]
MAVVVLLITLSGLAQALALPEAWEAAKANDPTFKQAGIQARISELEVKDARHSWLPGLEAGARSQWDDRGNHSNSYSISLNQTLWDSRQWAQLNQAQANQLTEQLNIQVAYNDLAGRLLNAYLDLASASDDVLLAQQKLDDGEKLLGITEQRYKAGKLQLTTVEDVRANHVDEQAGLLSAQAAFADRQLALAVLINRPVDQVSHIQIDMSEAPRLPVSSTAEWLQLAQDHSPDLLAAKQQLQAAHAGRNVAQAGYFPTVSGTLSYGGSDKGDDGTLSASVGVTVPIDLNGKTRIGVASSELRITSAEQDVRKVEIALKQNIETRFQQLQLQWQRIGIAHQQVESRQRALALKQAVYDAGLVEASELIDAHNALFASRHELQGRLYQYWQQRVELMKAAGMLNDESIADIARVFVP